MRLMAPFIMGTVYEIPRPGDSLSVTGKLRTDPDYLFRIFECGQVISTKLLIGRKLIRVKTSMILAKFNVKLDERTKVSFPKIH